MRCLSMAAGEGFGGFFLASLMVSCEEYSTAQLSGGGNARANKTVLNNFE